MVVIDAVWGEVMLFEILFADDLVLMADSMEELRLKFDNWKDATERKGRKLNMGKLMVSGERVVSHVVCV